MISQRPANSDPEYLFFLQIIGRSLVGYWLVIGRFGEVSGRLLVVFSILSSIAPRRSANSHRIIVFCGFEGTWLIIIANPLSTSRPSRWSGSPSFPAGWPPELITLRSLREPMFCRCEYLSLSKLVEQMWGITLLRFCAKCSNKRAHMIPTLGYPSGSLRANPKLLHHVLVMLFTFWNSMNNVKSQP